ncbi:Ser/Thr protein phosphatase [Tritrichomonas foetus]|uniref:Ser/Thr protein phosphatase n=1 Tax=Tritrichomonas foetus TaxID=1144522 RepID=A0A1J4K8D1_9EUKA|nr:Ser/Thr protein phosphatase [Tritrichomonas foetus]|eukprot:OHT07663.1 Ser/Thr protein phosphatase [Tritrichomonas foetus]
MKKVTLSMNQNFGQIFQCPLVNTTVTSFKVPFDPKNKLRVLLISDTHLGALIDTNKAIQLFFDELSALIKAEGINMICHLGDLVDGTLNNGSFVLQTVLKKLSELRIPVYVIGGNHDRDFFNGINWKQEIPNVYPLKENSIVFELPKVGAKGEPQRLFLAHDLLNNYRVRDQFAFCFVAWIKDACKKFIKPTDWLITGHTHTSLISFASRLACVGQYSPEINVFGYTLLDFENGDVSIATKLQPNKIAPK